MKFILINTLTFLRVPLSLMVCSLILFYAHPLLPCIMLFTAIWITDYFDGKLARKYHAQTDFGAKLDVASDLFFILMACLSFTYLNLFPLWMVGVILFKFMEFMITSFIHKRNKKSISVLRFDSLGRFVAVSFYLLPALVLLLYTYNPRLYGLLLQLVCISITILAALSSIFRITSLLRVSGELID